MAEKGGAWSWAEKRRDAAEKAVSGAKVTSGRPEIVSSPRGGETPEKAAKSWEDRERSAGHSMRETIDRPKQTIIPKLSTALGFVVAEDQLEPLLALWQSGKVQFPPEATSVFQEAEEYFGSRSKAIGASTRAMTEAAQRGDAVKEAFPGGTPSVETARALTPDPGAVKPMSMEEVSERVPVSLPRVLPPVPKSDYKGAAQAAMKAHGYKTDAERKSPKDEKKEKEGA